MWKEMPVIPVSRVVDPKKNNRKKWRTKEEEKHKGSLTHKKDFMKWKQSNFRSECESFITGYKTLQQGMK
jgi:hypothetical protein